MIALGQNIFRFDTFGDETFWTDTLRMHEVIRSAVDPLTALAVGLKVDAEALPPEVVAGILDGSIPLDAPSTTVTLIGLNAVVGRPREDWIVEPTRFDEMRPGCYDPDARVRDMDINGVWAAVNFPSQITGFCGSVFSRCSDPALGLAVTRAWNDWFFDEWYGPHPDRMVPMGITYLADPEQGAAEIRRNAARGFTAVTLPELPHRIGMEPIFSDWWDPIIAACAETDTVICLHVGSTGIGRAGGTK